MRGIMTLVGPVILSLIVSDLIIGVAQTPKIAQQIVTENVRIFEDINKWIYNRHFIRCIQLNSDNPNAVGNNKIKDENAMIRIIINKALYIPKDIAKGQCEDIAKLLDQEIEITSYKILDLFKRQVDTVANPNEEQGYIKTLGIKKLNVSYVDDSNRRYTKAMMSSKLHSSYPSLNIKLIIARNGQVHEQVHNGCNDRALSWILQSNAQLPDVVLNHLPSILLTMKTNKPSCLLTTLGLITIVPTLTCEKARPTSYQVNPNDKSQTTSAIINTILRTNQDTGNTKLVKLGTIYIATNNIYNINRLSSVIESDIDHEQLMDLLTVITDEQIKKLTNNESIYAQTKTGLLLITVSDCDNKAVIESAISVYKSINSKGLRKSENVVINIPSYNTDLALMAIKSSLKLQNDEEDYIKIIPDYYRKRIMYITHKCKEQSDDILNKLMTFSSYNAIRRIIDYSNIVRH